MATKNKNHSVSEIIKPAHREFVKNYFICNGKAAPAYMMTYPKTKYNSAMASASRLLKNINIQKAIEREFITIWEKKDSEIEKSKTFLSIRSLAFSNIFDIIQIEDGNISLKDDKDIPLCAQGAIKSIEYKKIDTKFGVDVHFAIQMHSKIEALKLCAKIQRMYETHAEVEGEIIIIPAVRPSIPHEDC